MNVKDLKQDLSDVRYYYNSCSRDIFEDSFFSDIRKKVKMYDKLIISAPLNLQDLYLSLYHRCLYQSEYAYNNGVSPQYVNQLVRKLFDFFLSCFEEENKSSDEGKKGDFV